MEIKEITNYKGHYCATLEDGRIVINNGSMELAVCEKVEQGLLVKTTGIVAGLMMRTEQDFRWAVEHFEEDKIGKSNG